MTSTGSMMSMLRGSLTSAVDVARTSLLVRRPFRRATIWFDEIGGVNARGALDGAGKLVPLLAAQRDVVARALVPPAPTTDAAGSGQAWAAFLAGSFCPKRAVGALIDAARALGASDIHLEPQPSGWSARVRIDGALRRWFDVDSSGALPLLAALKAASRCLPYRSDVVQEGRVPAHGVAADVRASFAPTVLGERAALRLFGRLRTLDELGLDDATHARLVHALALQSGLVLVSGASGAGKTTTIYAALAHIARTRGGAHLSLEDPVEQRLRFAGIDVDQVELDPDKGITAETMLVAALRQDIDVLAVGEIRTPAEAGLALRAAHTGRLVLAGVHAGDVRQARARLIDLGLNASDLDGTLHAVMHQALLPGDRGRTLQAVLS